MSRTHRTLIAQVSQNRTLYYGFSQLAENGWLTSDGETFPTLEEVIAHVEVVTGKVVTIVIDTTNQSQSDGWGKRYTLA